MSIVHFNQTCGKSYVVGKHINPVGQRKTGSAYMKTCNIISFRRTLERIQFIAAPRNRYFSGTFFLWKFFTMPGYNLVIVCREGDMRPAQNPMHKISPGTDLKPGVGLLQAWERYTEVSPFFFFFLTHYIVCWIALGSLVCSLIFFFTFFWIFRNLWDVSRHINLIYMMACKKSYIGTL